MPEILEAKIVNTETHLNDSPRFNDRRLGDQKCTLTAAKATIEFLRRFGIYVTLFHNPTFPNGTFYEIIDRDNEKQYNKGEYIFVVSTAAADFCNVDLLMQTIEDPRRPASEKLERICRDLKIYSDWNALPVVQKIVADAIQAKFDE